MKGLLKPVVTETMWSITPSSSGLVTLAMLKMFLTVLDSRFRQPRGSWALATSDASGAHSRLQEQIFKAHREKYEMTCMQKKHPEFYLYVSQYWRGQGRSIRRAINQAVS